jgi:hypothetical protein
VTEPAASLIDGRTHYDITTAANPRASAGGPPSPGIQVIVNWMAKLK